VTQAIQKAECLPAEVKEMFKAVIGQSLAVPREGRAACQQEVVEMIGAALAQIEAWHVERASKTEASSVSANAELEAARAARDAAAAASKAEEAAVAERRQALAEAGAAVDLASTAVREAEKSRADGDERLEAARSQKEMLEGVRGTSFVPIKEGSVESAEEAARVVDSLVRLGKDLGFDESLNASLGAALAKEPGRRGGFDDVVLSQFEAELARRIDALGAELAEGEPARAERARAVEEAEARRQAAEGARAGREGELAAAQAREAEAGAAAKAAQEAAGQAEAALALAVAKLEKAQADLATVRESALASFHELNSQALPEAAVAKAADAGKEAEATNTTEGTAATTGSIAGGAELAAPKHTAEDTAMAVAAATLGA